MLNSEIVKNLINIFFMEYLLMGTLHQFIWAHEEVNICNLRKVNLRKNTLTLRMRIPNQLVMFEIRGLFEMFVQKWKELNIPEKNSIQFWIKSLLRLRLTVLQIVDLSPVIGLVQSCYIYIKEYTSLWFG